MVRPIPILFPRGDDEGVGDVRNDIIPIPPKVGSLRVGVLDIMPIIPPDGIATGTSDGMPSGLAVGCSLDGPGVRSPLPLLDRLLDEGMSKELGPGVAVGSGDRSPFPRLDRPFPFPSSVGIGVTVGSGDLSPLPPLEEGFGAFVGLGIGET